MKNHQSHIQGKSILPSSDIDCSLMKASPRLIFSASQAYDKAFPLVFASGGFPGGFVPRERMFVSDDLNREN